MAKELTYGKGNMKMKELATHLGIPFSHIETFDLPAGWTCPKANICLTRVNRQTGKLAKFGKIVCYATKAESAYPAVRASRWRNLDRIKACKSATEIADVLERNLYSHTEIVRIHASGDFFKRMYFDAWLLVAKRNPNIQFFAYTKILEYAIAETPDNFFITYSYGSKDDEKRDAMAMHVPTCYINTYENEHAGIQVLCGSKETGYEDFEAIKRHESFALNMH